MLRLTYRQFKEAAHPLARALQDAGFANGTRAAIIMTNQSKWLISAYAIFFCGGVLVPLDYKLTPAEQLKLLAHSKAEFLVIEYHLWRAITQGRRVSGSTHARSAGHRSARRRRSRGSKTLGGISRARASRRSCRARAQDAACIVYSSGTGGRPKGCVLTHENYLEQCMALTSLFPFWPGVRYLEHSADESCHRFHGRLHRAIHLRRRPWCICARCGRNLFATPLRDTKSPT